MNIRRFGMAVILMAALVGCNNSGQRQSQRSQQPILAPEKFDLVKEPDINAETRFAAGQLAESRGDLRRAGAQYAQALKVDPNHLKAMNRLAIVYAMTRQFDQSIEIARRYVNVTHQSSDAWNNLAQCYEFANRTNEAEDAYKSGIAKDPGNVPCRVNYGLMLARKDRIDEARTQMAVVLKPAEVHYNIASVLEMQGNKAAAKKEFQKALEVDPTFNEAKKRLAVIE